MPDYPAGYPASGQKKQIRPNLCLDTTTDESVQEEPDSLDNTTDKSAEEESDILYDTIDKSFEEECDGLDDTIYVDKSVEEESDCLEETKDEEVEEEYGDFDESLGVVGDPLGKVADFSVDSGTKESRTAPAPANNSAQVAAAVSIVANQRTTRITLATVLSALPCANHAVSNGEGILQFASTVCNYRYIHLHKYIWSGSS